MRVVCIDGDGLKEMFNRPNNEDYTLKTGDIYTVILNIRLDGIDFYLLSEKPSNCIYQVRRFAPLSSIDETTFERNYKKEKV